MRAPQLLIPSPLAATELLSTDSVELKRSIVETRAMTYSNDFSYWNLRDRFVCQMNALGVAQAHEGFVAFAEESLEQARGQLLAPTVYPLSLMPESYGIRVDNLLTILNLNLALLHMHGGSEMLAAHWLGLARQAFRRASEAADRNPLVTAISETLEQAETTAAMLRRSE